MKTGVQKASITALGAIIPMGAFVMGVFSGADPVILASTISGVVGAATAGRALHRAYVAGKSATEMAVDTVKWGALGAAGAFMGMGGPAWAGASTSLVRPAVENSLATRDVIETIDQSLVQSGNSNSTNSTSVSNRPEEVAGIVVETVSRGAGALIIGVAGGLAAYFGIARNIHRTLPVKNVTLNQVPQRAPVIAAAVPLPPPPAPAQAQTHITIMPANESNEAKTDEKEKELSVVNHPVQPLTWVERSPSHSRSHSIGDENDEKHNGHSNAVEMTNFQNIVIRRNSESDIHSRSHSIGDENDEKHNGHNNAVEMTNFQKKGRPLSLGQTPAHPPSTAVPPNGSRVW